MIELPESRMRPVPLNASLCPSTTSSDKNELTDTVASTMNPEEYRKRCNQAIIDRCPRNINIEEKAILLLRIDQRETRMRRRKLSF